MTRYALNSAVLTAFGTYEYEPLNRTAAREWWEAGPVVATIGYEETCIAMERVLGIPRPRVNRRTIEMDPGDETVEGWCCAELIALVDAPGSDERIRAVLDAPTDEERRAAADRLTDADWERLAQGVEHTPADLEAAVEEVVTLPGIPELMRVYGPQAPAHPRGTLIDLAEAAAAESLRREREPDPDR